MYKTNQLI